MLLIVITHTECFPGEAELLNGLFAAGLAVCHLRKPGATAEAVWLLLNDIEQEYHDRIALHQHHQYGIKRLHFTEQQRMAMDASKYQGYTLSTSVHDLSSAQQLPAIFSYAFFSPVFDSISKPNYHAVVGKEFIFEKKAVPMVALGGVDADNIGFVKKMNFDGAAIMGTLWKEPGKAIGQFKIIQELCAHT